MKSFGIRSDSLTTAEYQALADLGWRRCGTLLYRPNNREACCPLVTIRTDASRFRLEKGAHRRVLGRLARHIGVQLPTSDLFDFFDQIPKERFRVTSRRSSYTEEAFELYRQYQVAIHHDSPSELTPLGYQRFLVDSPLRSAGGQEGTLHQCYYIDDTLVAVGVVDVLPECLSDPAYSRLSLGTLSSLYEIYYLQRSLKLTRYYMGYYVRGCPKMSYKAQYEPCYLLDEVGHEWVPFEQAAFDPRGNLQSAAQPPAAGRQQLLTNYTVELPRFTAGLADLFGELPVELQDVVGEFAGLVNGTPFQIKLF